jgi:integrase
MSYVVQRKDRFCVVAYDGLDPLTGRERQRWHPVGHDRDEAEQLAARLDHERDAVPPAPSRPTTFGEFLTNTWIPHKRRQVRATTAYRYAWFVDRYIQPAVGDIPLRRLRADHLDTLYDTLAATGSRDGAGRAPKTVLEVHAVVRAALDHAVARRLVDRNVARDTRSRRRPPVSGVARSWTAAELSAFLTAARGQRLYPALHLAAHTGMRRGEIVGLKWSDLSLAHSRLSVSRTLQNVGGRPAEFAPKTRTSRRTVELDRATLDELRRWRRQLGRDGLPCRPDDWTFCNTTGRFLNPESISQLFDRKSSAAGYHGCGSTTCATPTRRCSSLTGPRSRSCPNASVTPTRRSPCTPTSTCCRA